MHILYDGRILQNPTPSGVGYYARYLCDGLLQVPDTSLRIFTNSYRRNSPGLLHDLPAQASVLSTHYPNKLLTLAWSLGDLPSVSRITSGCNVVLCPHISVLPTTRIPKIVTIHDLSYEHFPQFHGPKERFWHQLAARSARSADLLIADSYATKEDILKIWGIPSRRIKVIYPGAPDLSAVEAAPWEAVSEKFQIRTPYLLAVGTLEPRKNLVRLVSAFAQLKKEPAHRDLMLVLAGNRGSDYPNIYREILKKRIEDSIVITGYLTCEQKKTLYEHASVFVYPSLYEGFGFPLLEAMQMGVPVVAARVSSIPEVTGDAALLIDPYDTHALGEAIRSLVESSTLSAQLIARGENNFRKFSWSTCTEAVVQACLTVKA